MTTTNVLLAFAIGAVLGTTTGYALWHEAAPPEPAADEAEHPAAGDGAHEPGKVDLADDAVQDLGITTAPLQSGSGMSSTRAPGRLQTDPAFAAVVRAPLAGTLTASERPFPRLGTVVHAGEVLAVLTPRLSTAEVADLMQRRATTRADEATAKAAIAAARSDLDRQRTLHAHDNAASQRAVELAEVELATQAARLTAAQQALAALTGTALDIRITAPIDGVVDAIGGSVGEDVDAGAQLFTLHAPGHLLARVEVSAGTPVAANLASAPLELLTDPPGRLVGQFVAWADGIANDRALLLAVTSDDATLRPGLPLLAHLPCTGEPLPGLVVPEAAIVRRGDGAYVFVRTQNHGGVSSFTRLPVALDAPVDGGWLAPQRQGGPAAGAELVITGAGTLFSIERQRSADAESGG